MASKSRTQTVGEEKEVSNLSPQTAPTSVGGAKSEEIPSSDLKNLTAVATVIRLIEVLNLEAENGWRQFQGRRYVYRVAADEETVELSARDGRGLILSRRDGKIEGELQDGDFNQLKLINEAIDQQLSPIRAPTPQKIPHHQAEELEL